MAKVKLGEKYRDTITGFVGTATARSEFLYGCVRVGLEGTSAEPGKPGEVEWFDEQRLVTAKDAKPVETNARTGGPGITPPSRDPRRRTSG